MKPTKEDITFVAGLISLCQQIRDKANLLEYDMILNIDIDGIHVAHTTFNRLFGDDEYAKEIYECNDRVTQKHSIMLGNVKVFALYHRGDEGWVEL